LGRRKLFCERGPLCYAVSLRKEYLLRWCRDLGSHVRFASSQTGEPLPFIVKSHRSVLLRKLFGVNQQLQQNKAVNLRLASRGIDGLLIRPGETFSFWRRVGNPTEKRGFLEGLVIIGGGKPSAAVGGGLCQLANLIHWLVLQSPLTVTELHHHTDAIFPDSDRRVPFGTGTSVFYNNVDYRFQNDTPDTYQLRVWLDETDLCGELLCSRELPVRYRIEERDHHYQKESDGWYYRVSEIWKKTIDRASGGTLEETMIFKNHSRVLFDESLIPPEQIR
jgi:vancomycin resistance protein VanW